MIMTQIMTGFMTSFNKSYIYFICVVSAMGGLLFGYDWVVIGGARIFYEQYFGIASSPVLQGLAMSIALAGCLAGAMTCGPMADRFGRKPLLLLSAAVFVVSSAATGAFSSFWWFLAARFTGGIAIGMASGLSPMYIAEVSPARIRGRLVTLNQLTIVLGILAAQVVNWRLAGPDQSWNVAMGWRWMFWATAVPASVFLVLAFFIPESPRWLMMSGRRGQAIRVLSRIGGAAYAEGEVSSFDVADRDSGRGSDARSRGAAGLLFSRPFRKVLLIGITVAVFQQWCGTNVIFNYAQEIFQGAGYDVDNTFINIVITGIANLVFTFVAILTVERLGRRVLMLVGAGGLALIYLILGWCYFTGAEGIFMVVLTVLAIACYAMSLGPVTWVLLSEIFPDRVRAVAMSVSTCALWIGSFSLTMTFPILNNAMGTYGTFWTYSAICAAGFLCFLRTLPETKGKSLTQIEAEMTTTINNTGK